MLVHTLPLFTTVLSAHLQAFMFDALFLVKIKHIKSTECQIQIQFKNTIQIHHPKRGTLIYYYTLENKSLFKPEKCY